MQKQQKLSESQLLCTKLKEAVNKGLARTQETSTLFVEMDKLFAGDSTALTELVADSSLSLEDHARYSEATPAFLWNDVSSFGTYTAHFGRCLEELEKVASTYGLPLKGLSYAQTVLKRSRQFLSERFGVEAVEDTAGSLSFAQAKSKGLPPRLGSLSRHQLQADFLTRRSEQELALGLLRSELANYDYVLAQESLFSEDTVAAWIKDNQKSSDPDPDPEAKTPAVPPKPKAGGCGCGGGARLYAAQEESFEAETKGQASAIQLKLSLFPTVEQMSFLSSLDSLREKESEWIYELQLREAHERQEVAEQLREQQLQEALGSLGTERQEHQEHQERKVLVSEDWEAEKAPLAQLETKCFGCSRPVCKECSGCSECLPSLGCKSCGRS